MPSPRRCPSPGVASARPDRCCYSEAGSMPVWPDLVRNAFVSWIVRSSPWELKDALIAELDLPLNLQGNKRNQFHPVLTAARARCAAQARAMPVLPNPGTGGR